MTGFYMEYNAGLKWAGCHLTIMKSISKIWKVLILTADDIFYIFIVGINIAIAYIILSIRIYLMNILYNKGPK